MSAGGTVVVLTGGVGGAKLVLGLQQVMAPERIVAVVNTGDDFDHLGLRVTPDIDTLLYTLSGLADREKGWGRGDETWSFMEALRAIGGEDWFALGDRDLALHVERTRRLAAGEALSGIIAHFAARLGVRARVVPMSDQPVATRVVSDEGVLDFQDYFVRRRCAPRIQAVRFDGAADARPAPAVLQALAAPDLAAVLIAPSNPWLSIDPILAVPGLAEALRGAGASIVAVTPLPGGRAVKGPTAKIMAELGVELTAASIERHYAGLVDAWLLDQADPPIATRHAFCDTLMTTLEDRARVARAALDLAAR
jgi:LPPG:FO 2-phospho-L-lactate transferase